MTKARVPTSQFFSFDAYNGDEELEKGTNTFRRFDLDPPFKLYGKVRDYVKVRTDGFIRTLNGAIWPFYVDIDTRREGRIFCRVSNATGDLVRAQKEIASHFTAFENIVLKWAVIATWINVAPDISTYVKPNTFQAVLTTDGVRSFTLLYYSDVQWYIAGNYSALAGFQMIDEEKREFIIDQTHDILTLEHRSNVGSPGKWIYRIDRDSIYEPDSMCPHIPQILNGQCAADDYILSSQAKCNCPEGYSPNVTIVTCSNSSKNGMYWSGERPTCLATTNFNHSEWLVVVLLTLVVLIIVVMSIAYLKFKKNLCGFCDRNSQNCNSRNEPLVYFRNNAEEI
ncbi:nidogen-like domain-containing protein [Ditylenchus destructor]|nr:nidogen-like domain-containing protein [Ditylenchus destructor]